MNLGAKIVVAGVTLIGGSNSIAVARLTAAGALDTSFDGGRRFPHHL